MAKCRPSKWVPWALVGAGLPFLAAAWLSTEGLKSDIATRAAKALSANELTAWGKVDQDGRDFTLTGTSPSQAAVDAAVAAVSGTYGVRTLQVKSQIVEPITLISPTVDSMSVASATPEIKGTWQEGVAKTLTVGVGDTLYKLGEAPELTTLAGEWTLKLAKPLPEGKNEVTVEVSDGDKVTMAAAAPGVITIALPKPLTPPTVNPFIGNTATPTFSGTWPEGLAKGLGVKVGETLFELGKNPELTSDGKGNWKLALAAPLPEGEVAVMPTITNELGEHTMALAPSRAIVDLTPPAAPKISVPTGVTWPFVMNGTWAEEPGANLTATFAGRSYEVNKAPELKSDGSGNFTFGPKAELAPGSYDIDFTTNDPAGNITRTLFTAAVVIPEPPKVEPEVLLPMEPATVFSQVSLSSAPIIKGAWPKGVAKGLTVTVGGRSYTLGKDANLQSKNGIWSLVPASSLREGFHDVTVDITDDKGRNARDLTVAEIEIDAVPPNSPTVVSYSGLESPVTISGTWDHKEAKGLAVLIPEAGVMAGLANAAMGLSTDGSGNWTLKLAKPLVPGTYNVIARSSDKRGRVQEDATTAELVVEAPPPPPVPMVSAAGLTGTWSEATSKELKAEVAGRTYVLGRGSALSSDGQGNFIFAPAAKFEPGSYDVTYTVTNADDTTATAVAAAAIVVAEPPPPPPPPPMVTANGLSGTWSETTSRQLIAELAGRTYLFGRGSALSSDGQGNFTFAPAAKLAPGSYDVTYTVANEDGSIAVAVAAAAIVVAEPPPPPPPPLPKIDFKPVAPPTGATWPYALTGTWPETTSKQLMAQVGERTYVLGRGSALTSDGQGNFTFAPAAKFTPGTYDVTYTVTNADDTTTTVVSAAAIVVAEPPSPPSPLPQVLPDPTVTANGLVGTWSEATSIQLMAQLGNRTYILGRGSALVSDGQGNFTFAPSAKLDPGSYDVTYTVTNHDGRTASTVAAGAIVVAEPPPPPPPPPPAPPTIDLTANGAPAGAIWPYALTGTWSEGVANDLTARLQGRIYKLNRGSALTSDGKGNFTFAPSAKLAPGTYDVYYTSSAEQGQKSFAVARGAIIVPTPPAPPPAPEPVVEPEPAPVVEPTPGVEPEPAPVVEPEPAPVVEAEPAPVVEAEPAPVVEAEPAPVVEPEPTPVVEPEPAPAPVVATELSPVVRQIIVGKLPEARVIDCTATFTRIHEIFPIRFAFDLDSFGSPYDQSVRQYAALLIDPRCKALRVEIAGHADYKGSIAYNQDLSERRAQRVLDALIAVGIDGARLSVKGYSEVSPIDPAKTDEARTLNRRVDMVLMK